MTQDLHDTERWKRIHDAGAPHRPERERATKTVLAITGVTTAVELLAGYATGSMALVADGWHMASHVLAMGLAYIVHVAARSPFMRTRMSFGTGKVSALGGYTSALFLAVIALSAGAQSVARFVWPVDVAFVPAILVAVAGLAVNVASVRILQKAPAAGPPSGPPASAGPGSPARAARWGGDSLQAGSAQTIADHVEPAEAGGPCSAHADSDPNHRAAVAHVLADALTSVLAIVALLGGRIFGWVILDPLMGVVGCGLVLFWAIRLIRGSTQTLLDFTPASGVETAVRDLIARNYDAVVLDVHVWEFAPRQLACQLSLAAHQPLEPEHVKNTLASLSALTHVTVEVNPCREDH